jgi:hypothetical protein
MLETLSLIVRDHCEECGRGRREGRSECKSVGGKGGREIRRGGEESKEKR